MDQLRADYLERFAPYFVEGGFKRFLAGGLVFTDCHHRHGVTKTGPGHAVILSGVHANQNGIIGNEWRLRTWPGLEQVNCVEDRAAPLVGLATRSWRSPGGVLEAKAGRSPRSLLASTVGDQLKLRHGARAKVFAVANKDRAAIPGPTAAIKLTLAGLPAAVRSIRRASSANLTARPVAAGLASDPSGRRMPPLRPLGSARGLSLSNGLSLPKRPGTPPTAFATGPPRASPSHSSGRQNAPPGPLAHHVITAHFTADDFDPAGIESAKSG